MKICHVCKAECPDTSDLCPFCGAQLREDQAEKTAAVIKNPVLAVSVDDPVNAEIFEDVLKDAKIPYSLGDENGGVMHMGFGGGFFAVDFYVDEENLSAAQSLYEEVKCSSEPIEEE